ncbi:MAG: inositol monophosphatase [Myxococcales bacterium]|nr:MAG: inositol monophosphatase [Myxococcales bacterium]
MRYDSTEYLLAFAREQVILAGQMALKAFRHVNGWLKENRSLVTEADMAVQGSIQEAIRRKFPDHQLLSEEFSAAERPDPNSEWLWVLDPIDGTEAFASGLPVWGVSLALYKKGRPVLGVFYMPVTQEFYHAAAEGPAMLTLFPGKPEEQNRELRVTTLPTLTNRTLFCIPSDFHRKFTSDFPGKQRTMGSIAAHLCIVARGDAIGAIFNVHCWDIAAGALIIRKAGGELYELATGEPVAVEEGFAGQRLPWGLAVPSKKIFNQIKPMLTPRL